MLQSVSPYALLKGSKPAPPAVYTTNYDLFSAVSQGSVPSVQPYPPQTTAAPPAVPPPIAPQRKTHYISDIKARHSCAAKNAQQTTANPILQSPPSRHTPSA